MTRIDAHQHFWRLDQNDCEWPTAAEAAIHRDFLPGDLRPLMEASGVDGTVLVQTQPSDRDTDFLLGLADDTPWVKAVVGWVDLKSAHAPARIAQLSAHPKLRGLRPMLQSLEDDWIADPALDPAVAAMMEHGLSFDALVKPPQLSALEIFARRHPGLPIVIDHGAKPLIAMGAQQPWRTQMTALAALPQVFCKLSGLVTETAAAWTPSDLKPYVDHLVRLFGPHRLMWGSDWPVLNLAGDYEAWLRIASELTDLPDIASRDALFGGTARAFYRIA